MHADIGFPLPSTKLVSIAVLKLLNDFCNRFDRGLLIPHRKEPFTRAQLRALVSLPDGTPIPGGKLVWDSRLGRSLMAAIAVAALTGFRKAEWAGGDARRLLNTSDVSWLIGGAVYAKTTPPLAVLSAARDGDFLILRPPPSKADPWDAVWGADPIYLPFVATLDAAAQRLCPFRTVAKIYASGDKDPSVVSALFTDSSGLPFTDSRADTILQALLSVAAPDMASKLSWHSMRIHLACALLASGARPAEIQALCRWQSEESLQLYARLNRMDYARLLKGAMEANIDSARTTSLSEGLPCLSAAEALRPAAGWTTQGLAAALCPADDE